MPDFPQPNSCYCFDPQDQWDPSTPDSVLPNPTGPGRVGNHPGLPTPDATSGAELWCDCNEYCDQIYDPDDLGGFGIAGICCPNTNSCVCVAFDDIQGLTMEEILGYYCDDPMGRCCKWLHPSVLDEPVYRGCQETHKSACTIHESDLGMHSPRMKKYILEWWKFEFAAGETCLSAPCVEEESMKCCESCRYDFPAGTFPNYIHSGKDKDYETVYYKICYENMSEEWCDRLNKVTNPINPTSLPPGFEDFEDIKPYFNYCTSYSFPGSMTCDDAGCSTGWYDVVGNKLE